MDDVTPFGAIVGGGVLDDIFDALDVFAYINARAPVCVFARFDNPDGPA